MVGHLKVLWTMRSTRLRFHQISLRFTLAMVTLVAVVLGALPHVQSARERARRMQCTNNLRQHSGFHGLGCDICRPLVLNVVRGSNGYTKDVSVRLIHIRTLAAYSDPDHEIVAALQTASRDPDPSIREAADAALAHLAAEAEKVSARIIR